MNIIDNETDKMFRTLWKKINFNEYEIKLMEYQKDIVRAVKEKNKQKVTEAQNRLLSSFEAKAIAVRDVSNSTASPGVDRVLWKTHKDKWLAASSLNTGEYHAKPMRPVHIHPRGDKVRRIQIPTCYDRAMQLLYSFALRPIAETTGDRCSFSARRGRSTWDVHSYVMRMFEVSPPPKYVVKADVKSFYETVSHRWLFNNIPINKDILKEFLKCGFVFGGELFPPEEEGISLGSPISPVLANMVLDGLQGAIYRELNGPSNHHLKIDYANGRMVRFADDILVSARSADDAGAVCDIIQAFLKKRGLTLSFRKTKIIRLNEGFDFLSRHYEFINGNLYATPSERSISELKQWLQDTISQWQGSQEKLIHAINRKLVGWATPHKVTDTEEVFRHLDCFVDGLLLDACTKRHYRVKKEKVLRMYFYREADGGYVYKHKDKPDLRITRLKDIAPVVYRPVATNMNPYTDPKYFEKRTNERKIATVTGKYKPIWARQGGKCYYCGKRFAADEIKRIITIDPAMPNFSRNLAYVHRHCYESRLEIYHTDEVVVTNAELCKILSDVKTGSNIKSRKRLFKPLEEFFRTCKKAVFTLTFAEIEQIIGKKLRETAKKQVGYWYSPTVEYSYVSHGYELTKTDLEKCRLSFRRCVDTGVPVIMPKELKKRIPEDANVELQNSFNYIIQKYAL